MLLPSLSNYQVLLAAVGINGLKNFLSIIGLFLYEYLLCLCVENTSLIL